EADHQPVAADQGGTGEHPQQRAIALVALLHHEYRRGEGGSLAAAGSRGTTMRRRPGADQVNTAGATCTQLRPARLDAYSALSARSMVAAGVRSPSRRVATPTLTVSLIDWPSQSTASRSTAARRRSPTWRAAAPLRPGKMAMNSSPP